MDTHPNAPGNGHGNGSHTHDDFEDKPVNLPAALADQTLAVDLAQIEINQMIATAHRFPRDIRTALKKATSMVLFDEASAENSIYALPRGGKPILGPSIGLANSLAASWGNCWDYSNHIGVDRRDKMVIAQGVFVDWETNRTTKQNVTRRISDRNGRLFNDDMIMVTSQAAQQIARRNAILNAIPRPLWFPIYEKALFVVRGSEATLPEKREKAIRSLAQFGIEPAKIFLYLQVKDANEIGIEHLPTLRAMYTQLRDGSITVEEMFDPRHMLGGDFEQFNNPLGGAEETVQETRTHRVGNGGNGQSAPSHLATGGNGQSAVPGETAGAGGAGEDLGTGGVGGGGAANPSPGPSEGSGGTGEATTKRGRPKKAKPEQEPPAEAVQVQEPAQNGGAASTAESTPAAEEVFPEPHNRQSPDAYAAYAMRWIAKETSHASARDRWNRERGIRNNLNDRMPGELMAQCQEAMGALASAAA